MSAIGIPKKRKWTAAIEEPLPSAPDDLDSWRSHPRLQRHAQNYRMHEDHGKLLEKYAKNAVTLDRKTLLRCICHVGAWVTLLPIDNTIALARDRSPVLLLAQLLRMRGTGKLTPWLHGVLRLVAGRLVEVKQNSGTCGASSQWKELRHSMPSKALSKHGRHQVAAKETMVSSNTVGKRLRLFHNNMSLWNNCDMPQRCELVNQLQALKCKLEGEMDTIQLRAFLRQLFAALSPPRALAQITSNESLDPVAESRLQQAALLQKSIRQMLLWGLSIWRNKLNLEDEQIHHLLMHAECMITRFEQSRKDISQCCAGKQWVLLKSFVMAADPQGQSSVKRKQPGIASQQSKRFRSRAKLEEAALLALQRLGNEATPRDLIDKMRSDEDIWLSIADEANRGPTKGTVRMKGRKLEAWEANIVSVFPQRHCLSTGTKKDGLTVWRLRSSSQSGT